MNIVTLKHQWPLDSLHKHPQMQNFDVLFNASSNKALNKVEFSVIWGAMRLTSRYCNKACLLFCLYIILKYISSCCGLLTLWFTHRMISSALYSAIEVTMKTTRYKKTNKKNMKPLRTTIQSTVKLCEYSCDIQSSNVITRFNIVRYYINIYRN